MAAVAEVVNGVIVWGGTPYGIFYARAVSAAAQKVQSDGGQLVTFTDKVIATHHSGPGAKTTPELR